MLNLFNGKRKMILHVLFYFYKKCMTHKEIPCIECVPVLLILTTVFLLFYQTKKQVKLIDASRDDPPYNKNSYPGFDPMNQRIGILTDLDKLHESGLAKSDNTNAMDYNWKA